MIQRDLALQADAKRLPPEIERIDAIAPTPAIVADQAPATVEAVRDRLAHFFGDADDPAAADLRDAVRGAIDKIVVTPQPGGSSARPSTASSPA
jgi:hypothetical protein